ncbi:MAG: hypothetical protein ACO38V_11210 [Phycisphaerales bacterium]
MSEIVTTQRRLAAEEMQDAADGDGGDVLHRFRQATDLEPPILVGVVGLDQIATEIRRRSSADDDGKAAESRDRRVGVGDRRRDRCDRRPRPILAAIPKRISEDGASEIGEVAGERWIARNRSDVANLASEDEQIAIEDHAAAVGASLRNRRLGSPGRLDRGSTLDAEAPVIVPGSRSLGSGAADRVKAAVRVKQGRRVARLGQRREDRPATLIEIQHSDRVGGGRALPADLSAGKAKPAILDQGEAEVT